MPRDTEKTKAETLRALQEYFRTQGRAPTYMELGRMLGITHVAAYNRVVNLARDKKVRFWYGQWRGIRLV